MSIDFNKGGLYGLLAAVSLATMAFVVHTLSGQVQAAQVFFLRSLLIFLVLAPLNRRQVGLAFRAGAFPLWLRAVAGSIGILLYYTNLQNTTAANAALLHGFSRLFIIVIAWKLFHERLTRLQLFGVLSMFLGGFLVYLPDTSSISSGIFFLGVLGALAAAVAYLSLRIAAQSYPPDLIVVLLSFCSLLVAAPLAAEHWVPLSRVQWVQVTLVAVTALMGHMFMTLSYKYLFAAVANSIVGSSIIWVAILEVLFLSYLPTPAELGAYCFVFFGTVILNLAQREGC